MTKSQASYSIGATVADKGHKKVLRLDSEADYMRHVNSLQTGDKVTVTIETAEEKRSAAANRYLWGVIYKAIHDYTEQPVEDIHDEMCARFTAETISYLNPKSGEMLEFEVVRRTSGMTRTRFHKFVQEVKLFSQEFFGLSFEPEPEEYHQELERAQKRERVA